MKETKNSLSMGTKIGYGIAQVGDAIVYCILLTYLVYYLTAVAHINPGTAGTISSVALFLSAVATFFTGYLSDNCKAKNGRRRPFIKVAMPVIFIAVIGLYSTFGLEGNIAVLYYGIFAIVAWTAYCTFFVPYTALGAELTSDYNERTTIRSYAAVGTQAGNFIGTVMPLAVVGLFMESGAKESASWTGMTFIFVAIAIICIGIMVHVTKGKELIIDSNAKTEKSNLFKDYFEIIKTKPVKWLILAIICFIFVNSVIAGNMAFFVIYKLGMSESYVSVIFAVTFLVAIPLAAVINFVTQKLDKKKSFSLFFCISAAVLIAFRFIGVDSLFMLGLLGVGFVIANAAYWQLIAATIYDVVEVIELKTGKRVEGALSSLQSITQQIGASIAAFIMGQILAMNNFTEGAATQPPEALNAIEMLQTIIPSIGLLLGALMMALYPISKEKFHLVQAALEQKKKTGTYNKEGLERII